MCVALPYDVLAVDGATATVRRGDVTTAVSLLASSECVRPGDRVRVHSGFVLARLDDADVEELAHIAAWEVSP